MKNTPAPSKAYEKAVKRGDLRIIYKASGSEAEIETAKKEIEHNIREIYPIQVY